MTIRNILTIVLLCLLSPYFALAQSNYSLINDATVLPGCHCYQLTPDVGNSGGGVYQNNTINLNNSFDYKFNVYLGNNGSSGADGICFILTNNITAIGAQGGGLGYSGLPGNSLAVEYDTYQNGWDPNNHHMAIEYSGQVQHPTGTLSGPVDAIVGGALMDDGAWHTTEIIWNVNTQTYSAYFDGVLRLTYTGNIVAQYFANNPIVNWGWSGSTGGAENTQQFCVLSTSNWVAGTNYQSCAQTMSFTDISTSNVATVQSWAWNFGDPGSGGNNTSSLQNPTHTFSTTGTFTVTLIIIDISGCPDTFSHIVTIAAPISMAPTLTNPLCNGGNNGDISVATSGGFGASAGLGGYQYTWSNGQSASSDIGLTAGTYNLTVTDGICTSTASYTLNQPSALSATTSSTAAPCGGTGTATITISGGTTPYNGVTWDGIAGSPGPNTYTSTGLPVGTVVANFHDANGCSAILTYTQNIIQLPCGYTQSTSSTNVSCFGGSNGSVTLTVTGSVGAVTIDWYNSGGTLVGTGATVPNLPAGVYTYHYSDQAPTVLSGTVTVTQPGGSMTVSLATVNTTCSYLNNGSAVASVTSNGTPLYSYSWSAAGQTNSPTATGLSPGNITVTVTDQHNCTATATGTVSGQAPLSLTTNASPDSCFQTMTGKTSVNVTGGTPNYTYQWSNGSTAIGDTVYNVLAGTYTVTVKDNNGCTATATAIVTQPTQLTATITDNNILCFGGANGSSTVTPAGGNGGYTYSWSNTITTAGISNVPPNKYYVTVTDSKLCTVVDSVTITQPAAAFTVTVAQTNVKCFGGSTGSITLTLSGGTTPYGAVTWTGGLTGLTPTNVAAGSYNYSISDANGCPATGTVTITQPTSAFNVAVAQTNVKCFGGSTGSITLTPSGGTTPYGAVIWTGGLTGLTPTNVAAGSYTYSVADANGCPQTGTVTITQPAAAFNVTVAQTNVKCFGGSTGSITLTLSGGTTPYGAVTWTGGLTGLTPTNVAAGSYTYNIADANGCPATGTVTITQPTSAFNVTATQTNVKCFGGSTGSITLTLSGGTTPYGAVTWTGGLTGLTPTNVAAGSYTYSVADANGCPQTGTVTITQPATAFNVAVAQTNVKCFGASTGSITLTLSGGTTPYGAVTWTGGLTGLTPTNVAAGSYNYSVADANGCPQTGTVTITQPASAFNVTATQTNVKCFGGSTGSITLTPSGGTTPYGAVTWTGGLTGLTPTNVAAGSYTYNIADANSCPATGTVTITQPATAFAVTATQTNVKCFGGSTGSITLTPSGGTTPYGAVTWTGGLTGLTPINVAAGSYTYNIADANGCPQTGTVTITQPTSAFAVAVTQTNVLCFGASTGTITLTPSGGTTPYGAVTWTGGLTGLTPTNVAAGSYTYSVADANGCPQTGTVTITQPASAFNVAATQTNVSCFGGSNGTITLTPSGGTTPYGAVTWTGGLTGLTPTNVAAGSYTYNIADANGCPATGTVTITQPTSAFAVAVSQTNVLCFGASTGTITLTPSGGTLPYATAEWLDGFVGDVRNNLAAGTYSYGDSDNNGCLVTGTVTITQPASAFAVTVAQTNVTCFGGSNGTITLTPSGGTTPYGTVTWTGGLTGLNPTNVAAGSYTYSVADANGCPQTGTVTITQPASAFAVAATQTNVSCFGGSDGTITLTPSGGTTPYGAVTWTGGATGLNPTGLSAGSYTYNIADANGCPATGTVTITQPATAFTVTSSQTNISCFNTATGTITLTPSGGTTPYGAVTWTGGLTGLNPTNVPAGSYTYNIADANGCPQTGTVTITQPATGLTVTYTQTNVSCFGGSDGTITLSPSGGVTPYSGVTWTGIPGATGLTPTGLTAGSYTYSISDASGCPATGTVTITQPSAAFAVATTQTNVSCFGGSDGTITLTPSGGTTPYGAVTWTGGLTGLNPTGVSAGSYTYTIADANNCSTTGTVTITQPTSAFTVTSTEVDVLCFGGNTGSITLSPSGGTTPYGAVTWTGGATGLNPTGLAAGSYTYNIADANGCPATGTVNIAQPASAFTVASTQTNVSCFGGSDGTISLTPSGGTTPYGAVTWTGGLNGLNPTNAAAGTYTYSIADANGCPAIGTVTITQATQISASNTTVPVTCYGGTNGSITVTPSGGTQPFTDSWSNGSTSPNATGLQAGTYSDTLTDANGCQYIDAGIIVSQPGAIGLLSDSITLVSCAGDSNGAISFVDTGGTPGYSYVWSQGSTSDPLIGIPVGSYTVTVTDANSCTTTATFTVGVNNPITYNATKSNVLCTPLQNGSISLFVSGGSPSYQYQWSNGATTSIVTNLPVGIDSVTVTDSRGCTVDTGFVIANDSAFTITGVPDTVTINQGDVIQLGLEVKNNGAGNPSYTWTPSLGLSCSDCQAPQASPFTTIDYVVNGVTDSGCTSSTQIYITVIPQHQFYVPNAFTPNNDGVNDYWEAFGNKKTWLYVNAEVYDRWGEKIFESNDINFQWDGKYRGQYVTPGEYVYIFKVVFIDDYSVTNKGTITVIR